jgi:hypothetical protein
LWKAGCAERIAHRVLVRQEMSCLRPDTGKPELLGDGRDDGHGTIGGDREHAVDSDPLRDLDNGRDVAEVDNVRDVSRREPGGLGIAIDGRDAQPARPCLLDGASLMASSADEEDGLHGRRW